MGFLKESYPANRAGLVVSFAANAYDTDSIQEAMEHFNLYLANGVLMEKSAETVALTDLGINPTQAVAFRNQVNTLIANLDDTNAVANVILFPQWDGNGVSYEVNTRVQYENTLYKVLQAHKSQPDWTPAASPSLFAKVLVSTDGTPKEWEQPNSTNGYKTGDIVIHNEKYWISLVDNNVWEPGATGVSQWKQCDEHGNNITAAWQAGVTYQIGDTVTYNDKTYKCIKANCVWSPNDLPSAWEEIA